MWQDLVYFRSKKSKGQSRGTGSVMSYQERAFGPRWGYVRMKGDSLCGMRKFQIELSSEVIIPRKRISRPCCIGEPVNGEETLDTASAYGKRAICY